MRVPAVGREARDGPRLVLAAGGNATPALPALLPPLALPPVLPPDPETGPDAGPEDADDEGANPVDGRVDVVVIGAETGDFGVVGAGVS